jgi:hypothetical protein
MGRQGQLCGNPERYHGRSGQVTSAESMTHSAVLAFQPLPSLPARRRCLTNRGRRQKGRKAFKHCAQSSFCGSMYMTTIEDALRGGKNKCDYYPTLLIESSRLHFSLESSNDLRGESC